MRGRSGLTIIELILAMGAATSLLLSFGGLVKEIRRRDTIVHDELLQLAEQRLVGQLLRRDLIQVTPSFNALKLESDQGRGRFFELNRSLGCPESSANDSPCRRTFTLNRGGTLVLLLDRPGASGVIYDPIKAYGVTGWVYSYTGLNRLGVVNTSPPALADRFSNGRLYLLRSLGEIQVYGPITGGANGALCHCGAVLQWCQASCSGKSNVPYLRPSVFLGVAAGVPPNGLGGELQKLTTPSTIGGIFAYEHPADPTVVFAANPKTFLETLPPLGDMISRAELREVSLVQFELLATGELYRSEWSGSSTGGFGPKRLLLGKRIRRVVLKRESISVPIVSFSVEQDAVK